MKQTNKTEYFHVWHHGHEYILRATIGRDNEERHYLQLPRLGSVSYTYGISNGFGKIESNYPEKNDALSIQNTYRVPVTTEEIAHLEACIEAKKYVKIPETKSLFQIY